MHKLGWTCAEEETMVRWGYRNNSRVDDAEIAEIMRVTGRSPCHD